MTAVEIALYALLLGGAAVLVWRRPVVALYLFVVGLALHNAAMAALFAAGVRGATLTAITAWKEILLAVALVRVGLEAQRRRALPFRFGVPDALALAFAALVIVYGLVPQSALGGAAGWHAVALAARHDLVPVAAWFLGRSLRLDRRHLARLGWTLLATAGFVAALGLVDVYAVSISWWRTNGVVAYFHDHLGYDYHGTGVNPAKAGLPENFVYNVGGNEPFLRRLVSTFLSPLASSYLFVVALVGAAALLRARRAVGLALCALVGAGLLWTFSRSALLALAVGLGVLALVRRRPVWLAAAVAVVAVAWGWAHVFPHVAPTGNWTQADLRYQAEIAKRHPGASNAPTSVNESSLHEHWLSLRDGATTIVDHPQGFGLGNVGQTASRTGTPLKAGESNYTELGVELGALGAALWIAWVLSILWALVRAASGERWAAAAAAAFAAILALAIQTDVIGDPWVAYCVWGFAGALAFRTGPEERLVAAAQTT
ncbi:MAG TPA: O-antigen ligase family protein [Gaiellaceae bacterium]|nr:O-antigen ligase family protein [Gaiellaceae bacterium]